MQEEISMDMMMHSINMYFYQTMEVKFLFKPFHTSSIGGYIAVLAVSIVIGFALEAVSFMREYIKAKGKSPVQTRILVSVAYLGQLTLAYLAMLIVMTFNFLLLVMIVVGMTVGYVCFGFVDMKSED